MRIAVLSDIHGNLTAFEAVLADLHDASPDLVLHGGDLADSGSHPAEIVDRIRALGWRGVMGNTDEMLVRPLSLEEFASTSAAPATLWSAVREMAQATRQVLGETRLSWMRSLPQMETTEGFTLLPATPHRCWRAPAVDATEAELEAAYNVIAEPMIVFGHTHRPGVRRMGQRLLVNAGSVGLPFDGDPRASYLLIETGIPSIRRVAYDVERELKALIASQLPGAEWTARILRTSSPQMP